jgi:GT2 family glycosyltransferase
LAKNKSFKPAPPSPARPKAVETVARNEGIPGTGQGILVLGMHRSGTSALARVIAGMGAHPGQAADLLPAHPRDNPAGYFERTDVMLAHDGLLEATGHAWDRVAGFDAGRLDRKAATILKAQIATTVATLQSSGAPWLVKDPRLCLFLPLWLEVAGNAACVVAVRDPREIAASLVETHRGVYPSHFLLALWQKYTEAMLSGLAGRRALFVSYDSLLDDAPRECQRLQEGLTAFGVTGLAFDKTVTRLLDRGLRRSSAASHARLSPEQSTLHDWLILQANARGPVEVAGYPPPADPDAALAEFERSLDDCARRARAAATGEFVERIARVEDSLNRSEGERSAWLGELTARREHVDQLEQAIATAHEDNLALNRASIESTARADRLQDALQAEQSRAATLFAALEQANANLATIRHDNEALHELAARQHAQYDVEISALRTEVDNLAVDRDAHQAARAVHAEAMERELAVQTAHANALDRELAAQTAHANALDRELAAQRAHANALEHGMGDLTASWSWRIGAPFRAVGTGLQTLRSRAEHGLARRFYAIPGIDSVRKRRLILWFHRHLPWLTRGTASYQLHARGEPSTAAANHSLQRMDGNRAAAMLAELGTPPRFAMVLRVRDTPPQRLVAIIDSVLHQFHADWELQLIDHGSTAIETAEVLLAIERSDPRIRIRAVKASRSVAAALNAGWRKSSADYVIFLEDSGKLARDALVEFACAAARSEADVLYADEDKIDEGGQHVTALFKPDFSPDLLLSTNYVGRIVALRRSLLEAIEGVPDDASGAESYALMLRAAEHSSRIEHVANVLYHQYADGRTGTATVVGASSEAALSVLRTALARRGVKADVERGRLPETYRVKRWIADSPLVSILLPFRDKPDLLRTCVSSILAKTCYTNFELIGIDNGSVGDDTHELMHELATQDERVRFVRHDVPFNYSAIVNFGETQARGEHLLMLNNDTEVISGDWIEALLEHSQRPEVGAVGALLLYPNDLIQHAGVIVGLGGVAGHAHLMLPARAPGYSGRAQVIQNLSAVTFACAMTRRDAFRKLGGLDETNLIAAYNDIDYCLRLREAGYTIVYTPYAELYHHESASRPHDLHPAQRARYDAEIRYMKERHSTFLAHGDPYYNPNLSLREGYLPTSDYVERLPG